MKIDHILLTRFNLPTPGVESLIRAKEGWLRDRQVLFERFCLPSVAAQNNTNFHWIIYFDTQSPQWLKNRIAELGADGLFLPIYRDEVPHQALVEDLRRVSGAGGEVLLTTNIDNDDGIAIDFVSRLQRSIHDDSQTAHFIVDGLIKQGRNVYLRRDASNAFCSVSESWTRADTCWADWHTNLGARMAVHEIGGDPGWLQVIHSGNVSNRVHGVLINPARYTSKFGEGLTDVAEPSFWQLATDRWVVAPARSGKAAIRAAGKKLILGIGGKTALNTFKVFLAGGSVNRVKRNRF